ncbi:hypothetical protein [Tsukamurella pseudospumae]|uniref:Lipoprotein n=1 Tax=Tsukamurella pseudospumae TaxID=239498 RepID=A0A137YTH5_9ACTN|nr:hypothetical protein [Tsukamurella pseudospumae]KXO89208.1 hypothetical protein AXK61_11410 [Tsukamurella pseudospumae]
MIANMRRGCRAVAAAAGTGLLVIACSPATSPGTTTSASSPASSSASSSADPRARAAEVERVRDLLVGTWRRVEAPNEVLERYLVDGRTEVVSASGAVAGAGTWEVVAMDRAGDYSPTAIQQRGDPRTRMVVAAIDWNSMVWSIPLRGTTYHYTRVGLSPLAGFYGGHWRGLTIRADGTGTGYYKVVCDSAGAQCENGVYYDFVLEDVETGSGFSNAVRRITRVRPSAAGDLLRGTERVRLDANTDVIFSGGITFCGSRARVSACGA